MYFALSFVSMRRPMTFPPSLRAVLMSNLYFQSLTGATASGQLRRVRLLPAAGPVGAAERPLCTGADYLDGQWRRVRLEAPDEPIGLSRKRDLWESRQTSQILSPQLWLGFLPAFLPFIPEILIFFFSFFFMKVMGPFLTLNLQRRRLFVPIQTSLDAATFRNATGYRCAYCPDDGPPRDVRGGGGRGGCPIAKAVAQGAEGCRWRWWRLLPKSRGVSTGCSERSAVQGLFISAIAIGPSNPRFNGDFKFPAD